MITATIVAIFFDWGKKYRLNAVLAWLVVLLSLTIVHFFLSPVNGWIIIVTILGADVFMWGLVAISLCRHVIRERHG